MKSRLKFNASIAVIAGCLTLGTTVSARAQETSPATEKFQADLKAAVMNGSVTVPQVRELKENLDILKAAKGSETPGAPIDLLTPYKAVAKIRAIMATVKDPDQTTLKEDFKLAMAAKQPASEASAEPATPGKKLGKDIFSAVMHGEPTEAQVQSLQDSLNALQSLKGSSAGGLQKLRTLKKAKTDIETTMNAGGFRPEDKQAVLDDLNSLGGGRG
jgi:hypothetical protein